MTVAELAHELDKQCEQGMAETKVNVCVTYEDYKVKLVHLVAGSESILVGEFND